jgi:hypothetical protein
MRDADELGRDAQIELCPGVPASVLIPTIQRTALG